MTIFLTVVHITVALFLIFSVLLQGGKGAGMGAAFGGGASQTTFGASGGMSPLAKLTASAAVIFMFTSMTLAYFASTTDSVVDDMIDAQQEQQEETSAVKEAPAKQEKKAEESAKPVIDVKAKTVEDTKAEEKPATKAVEPKKETTENKNK